MKKAWPFLLITISLLFALPLRGQHITIKSNLLYWATTTPNMGFEFRLGKKLSVDLWGAYNAWEFNNDMSLKHYLVQPELRYWPCQTFEGHFFGLHGHYGHFNIGNIPFIPGLEETNYRGELYGGGLTWGYHWVIGRHWGLEAFIGAGYAYMEYDKYVCYDCTEVIATYRRHYFGPTRAGVSLIFFIH